MDEQYEYTQDFMHKLLQLQEQKEFTDVTLKTQDQEFSCHWVVLSAASEYFHAMYRSGMKEANSNIVELIGTDSATLEAIVRYIYSAHIVITTENVQSLIEACDLFRLEKLKSKCESFMLRRVKTCTCIGFYLFAKLYSLKDLQLEAKNIMLDKFKETVQQEEFLQLSVTDLNEYISDDLLNVPNEDLVFDSVIRWVKHDQKVREDLFSQIISHIRLPYCTSFYLCDTVEECNWVSSPECQAFLKEARMFHLLLPDLLTDRHLISIKWHTNCLNDS